MNNEELRTGVLYISNAISERVRDVHTILRQSNMTYEERSYYEDEMAVLVETANAFRNFIGSVMLGRAELTHTEMRNTVRFLDDVFQNEIPWVRRRWNMIRNTVMSDPSRSRVRIRRYSIERRSMSPRNCAICQDELGLGAVCTLPCGHSFHFQNDTCPGIDNWASKRTCPLCRSPF